MTIEQESQLVREALVREIRDASRWSAVSEAWHALLHVRQMSEELIKEQKMLAAHQHGGGGTTHGYSS